MGAEAALPLMSFDEFLVWAKNHPGRYELEGGKVVAMSPERVRHAEIKGAAFSALQSACRDAGGACHALPDGVTVRIDAMRAYEPDALVYCGARLSGEALEVPDPIIIVEILSPSTAYRDVGAKLAGYFSLPSVAHYLIVDPDHPAIVHHARGDNGLIATRILSAGKLSLDPPGLIVQVDDVLAPAQG